MRTVPQPVPHQPHVLQLRLGIPPETVFAQKLQTIHISNYHTSSRSLWLGGSYESYILRTIPRITYLHMLVAYDLAVARSISALATCQGSEKDLRTGLTSAVCEEHYYSGLLIQMNYSNNHILLSYLAKYK